MDVDPKSYFDDPAARGKLNHLEHGLILASVQIFEGVVRGFLYLLLELIAPALMTRALASTPAAPAHPPADGRQFRFLLTPPRPPSLDRFAGLFGDAPAPEDWRVSFRFFRLGRQNALEGVSASYRLPVHEDPHEKVRMSLQQAADSIAARYRPALPLARRIEAARRVLADPRGCLARILQRLHRQPDLMVRRPPRIADPANDASLHPFGPTTDQIMALAEPYFRLDGAKIAAHFARLPDTS
jgi:hypothetical protein